MPITQLLTPEVSVHPSTNQEITKKRIPLHRSHTDIGQSITLKSMRRGSY